MCAWSHMPTPLCLQKKSQHWSYWLSQSSAQASSLPSHCPLKSIPASFISWTLPLLSFSPLLFCGASPISCYPHPLHSLSFVLLHCEPQQLVESPQTCLSWTLPRTHLLDLCFVGCLCVLSYCWLFDGMFGVALAPCLILWGECNTDF